MKYSLLILIALTATAGPQGQAIGGSILGSAENFAVLGASTVTNTGMTSISGELGVWPGTAITGFPPGIVTGGTIHLGDPVAMQAQADAATGFAALAAMPLGRSLTGQDLGGLTLTPGVYRFDSSAQLSGMLTLDNLGDSNALFVFQIGSTLTTSNKSSVVAPNCGDGSNVYWLVGSSATIGTQTAFTGNIIAMTSITLGTNTTIQSGRAVALGGAVTMDTITTMSVPGLGDACAPDLNSNGIVNGIDLAILLGEWTGSSLYLCPPTVSADFNCDCHVNGLDLVSCCEEKRNM